MTKQVEPSKQTNHLAEIMQNNKTQFALCRYDEATNKIIQCHQFVHCRDFMLDALVGVEDNRDMGIYGFSYSKENPRPDIDTTSVLIKFVSDGALKCFQNNFDILRSIEDQMGFNHTIVEVVDYPQKEVVAWVVGDARWQRATVLFSLYTYLLKCLTYEIKSKTGWMEEIRTADTVESRYMDPVHIQYLIDNAQTILDKYTTVSGFADQKGRGPYQIHDVSGFVAAKTALAGGHGYEKHALYNLRKVA